MGTLLLHDGKKQSINAFQILTHNFKTYTLKQSYNETVLIFFLVRRPDGIWAGVVSLFAKSDTNFDDRQLENIF